METQDVAETVTRRAAVILDKMGLRATPHYVRPGLWDLLNCVYVRDPIKYTGMPIRMVDVCIRDDRARAEDFEESGYTVGLIWQSSQPVGFSDELDSASLNALAQAACRAMFEVLLNRTLQKLATFCLAWTQAEAA